MPQARVARSKTRKEPAMLVVIPMLGRCCHCCIVVDVSGHYGSQRLRQLDPVQFPTSLAG